MNDRLHHLIRISGAGDGQAELFQHREQTGAYGGGAHGQHAEGYAFAVKHSVL